MLPYAQIEARYLASLGMTATALGMMPYGMLRGVEARADFFGSGAPRELGRIGSNNKQLIQNGIEELGDGAAGFQDGAAMVHGAR